MIEILFDQKLLISVLRSKVLVRIFILILSNDANRKGCLADGDVCTILI